ncbi:hypothetical protein TKK_0018714 [Trichogramma kaykai]|uniref:Glycosyl transferase CAP10 domain-containing protein n=1 Tax=Trichogramma kaykai TaxID=54128 RepID=A0ABD2VXD7_9HYME
MLWFWKLFIFFLLCAFNETTLHTRKIIDVDPTRTILWGPGLEPDKIVLRARYIFVQLVDHQGLNVTNSPGKNFVAAVINGNSLSNETCRVWSQIFDCKDGSFIIRYRLHETCNDLQIKVLVKNHTLPLIRPLIKGPIYEEECYCPQKSIKKWLEDNHCNSNHSQILRDLKLFPSVDFEIYRSKIISRFNQPHGVSLCHYVIKNNKIHRQCFGEHVGFKTFVDDILLSITRKLFLPDVEFFMNLGDWPLVLKNTELLPIFSWCGSVDSNDIILPTYDLAKSSVEAMSSVILDMLSVQASSKTVWEKKIEKVFWRGRDSNRARLILIDLSRKHPNLFNAALTNFFFFTKEAEKYGPTQKHVSFFDFFEYKYQLNIDGTVAAYRFPYLLAGDSLVFKQDSKYYEFFYKDLEAEKHFIPVKHNLSDLVEKVNWAINNDKTAYKITKNAQQFIRDNLMPQHIICYHAVLIQKWSHRITSKIKVFPEMEEVTQKEHECNCLNTKDDGSEIKDEL